MEKKYIDMSTWDRAEIYGLFNTFEMPYTNICTNIDITEFMRYIRQYDYNFFASFLFYIVKAVNLIEPFRYRVEDNKPVLFDSIRISYTLMRDSMLIGTNFTEFVDDFKTFYENVSNDIAFAKTSPHMFNKIASDQDVVNVTSIPWTNLSNFSQAVYNVKDAVPYIGIGKRFQQDEMIKLPIAVQAHHAFVDGYHVSHLLKLLELFMENPSKYSVPFDDYTYVLDNAKPFILSEKDTPISFLL